MHGQNFKLLFIILLCFSSLAYATELSDLNLTVPAIYANSYNFTENSTLLNFDGQTISFLEDIFNSTYDERYINSDGDILNGDFTVKNLVLFNTTGDSIFTPYGALKIFPNNQSVKSVIITNSSDSIDIDVEGYSFIKFLDSVNSTGDICDGDGNCLYNLDDSSTGLIRNNLDALYLFSTNEDYLFGNWLVTSTFSYNGEDFIKGEVREKVAGFGAGSLAIEYNFSDAPVIWDLQQSSELESGVPDLICSEGTYVKTDESWIITPSASLSDFITLDDTPGAFTGSSEYLVRVNSGVSALEFLNPSEDFLSQYFNINGRSGGQTLQGGTGAVENLTIKATATGQTPGYVILEDDLVTDRWEASFTNTIIGIDSAGYDQMSASALYNTLYGAFTLYRITDGTRNVALGAYAGYKNNYGSDNTYVGTFAGGNNTLGDNNTFIGTHAGSRQNDGSTALESPEDSVYIGSHSKSGSDPSDGEDTIINEIVIGYNATGEGSNTVVLGDENIINTYLKGLINIGSMSDIETEINSKPNASNVLERDNTDVYTPSSNYNPSTKKYVDDSITTLTPIDAADITDGSVSDVEFQYLDGVTSDIQTQLNAKVSDTGAETIAGVKTFSSFPVTPSSAPETNYQTANKKYVDDNSGSAVAPGTIIMWAGSLANKPAGTLYCSGATVSRTTYAALWSAIGTNWGYGDGSTTFHLPDFRGRFPRGVDGGAGRDPDANSRTASNTGGNTGSNVGSVQTDIYGSHTHGGDIYPTSPNVYYASGGAVASSGNYVVVTHDSSTKSGPGAWLGSHDHGFSIYSSGGSETRPENANVYYLIYY